MRFPTDDLQDLRAAGLMALAVPEEFGGRGASMVAYALAAETIAAADASLAVAWVMHTACGWEIAHAGQPDTRTAVLADVLNNGAFICIAGAEGRLPDGTPCPLKADREGDLWRLNGRKGFVSGVTAASYVVTGGTDAEGTHHTFVVPMQTPGLCGSDVWDGMGMRASATHGLAFDCVVVPESNRLTADYKTGDFRNTSALFGLGLSATALGIAQAALDFTIEWNKGKTLPDASKLRLGDMSVRVEAVRSLIWRSAWEADRDPQNCEAWVDRSKTAAVEMAHGVALDAMRVCGGTAFRQRYSLERNLRDSSALMLQGQRPDMLRAAIADKLQA